MLPLPLEHAVGRCLWRNLGVRGPSLDCEELPTSSYYALRAVAPTMLRVALQHEELSDAIDASRCQRRTEELTRLRANLESRWDAQPLSSAAADRIEGWEEGFASKVHSTLVGNLDVAVTYARRAAAVQDDERAAKVFVNLMRREHLYPTEAKVFELVLDAEGAFKKKEGAAKSLPPVSLVSKLVASVLCLIAFVGPIFFLLVFASSVGNKMTRCWYFSTLFFVFIAVFIVEPFTIFILKVFVPAFIYEKLRWMRDPCHASERVGHSCGMFVAPIDILFGMAKTPFDALSIQLPPRLVEHREVFSLDDGETILGGGDVKPKSIVRALVEKQGSAQKAPSISTKFAEAALVAEAAVAYRDAAAEQEASRHVRAKTHVTLVETHAAWSTTQLRHWRKSNIYKPPLYHVAVAASVFCVLFLNPAVRGCIVKQSMTMLSLVIVGVPLPPRLSEILVVINEYVPGAYPIILSWACMVGAILFAVAVMKVKFYLGKAARHGREMESEPQVFDEGDEDDDKFAMLKLNFGDDDPHFEKKPVSLKADDIKIEEEVPKEDFLLRHTISIHASLRDLTSTLSSSTDVKDSEASSCCFCSSSKEQPKITAALVYSDVGTFDKEAEEASESKKANNKFQGKLLANLKGQMSKGVGEMRKVFFPQ